MKEDIVALYIRLSLEDSKYDSMSIDNQRMILREKALSLLGIDQAEIREFVDNGHTGTNFERPAMQELLSLVQTGKVACILVKDFSRFGRNSIVRDTSSKRYSPCIILALFPSAIILIQRITKAIPAGLMWHSSI